jgi:hypothetical protein
VESLTTMEFQGEGKFLHFVFGYRFPTYSLYLFLFSFFLPSSLPFLLSSLLPFLFFILIVLIK